MNFQNRIPDTPEDFSINVATKSSTKKGGDTKSLLVASSGDLIYSGHVEKSSLVDNYLVIRNKTSNKVRLVPYNSCSLISEHYTSVPLSLPSVEDDKQLLRHSIAKYGGKNALRAQDRIARMRVNIDVIKDHLDQTIAMSTEQMKSEKVEEDRLMDVQDDGVEPQKNYEAKTIQELYNIRQIITPALVDELEEVAGEVLDAKPEDLP